MRTIKFNSEEEFLKELDGKVYAISDKSGEFLCDILEDDLCKLLDSGDIIDLCDISVNYANTTDAYSDYIISSGVDEDKFKEMYGVEIWCSE